MFKSNSIRGYYKSIDYILSGHLKKHKKPTVTVYSEPNNYLKLY